MLLRLILILALFSCQLNAEKAPNNQQFTKSIQCDPQGRLQLIRSSDGRTLRYQYNGTETIPASFVITETDESSLTVTLKYDPSRHITNLTLSKESTLQYSHKALSNPPSTSINVAWRNKQPIVTVLDGNPAYAKSMATEEDSSWWSLYNLTCSAASYVYKILSGLASLSDNIAAKAVAELNRMGILATDVESTAAYVLGDTLFFMTGYHQTEAHINIIGKGEVSDLVRITFINGILSPFSKVEMCADLISQTHGNANVHYVYRSTNGWTWDLTRGFFTKAGNTSYEANLLAQRWKELIAEMGGAEGPGTILHYAHSLGGCDSARAAMLLTKEEQRKLRIITFGSPEIVEYADVESCTNYISVRDGVAWLDPIGRLRAILGLCDSVIFLGSHAEGWPMCDHLFLDDTYRDIWEQLGKEFIETYGSIE